MSTQIVEQALAGLPPVAGGGADVAGTATGVWSAPGRVNLIGEHTDYNEGFVFPFAIQHRTAVAARVRNDRTIRLVSTFDPAVISVEIDALSGLFPLAKEASAPASSIPEWARYPLGVAWALLEAAPEAAGVSGVDLSFASNVPIGAGLSSSAAIEGATGSALNELWGAGLDRIAIAQVGRRAENEAVGAPTGIMDQLASMLGVQDAGTFIDCRSVASEVVPFGFAEAGLEILVMDTHVTHSHSNSGYADRRASCERGAREMGVASLRDLAASDLARARDVLDDETFRRVRHIVTENERVQETVRVLTEHGPGAIGQLLTASHESMRDDFEISVPELDLAVDTSLQAGALGARMTGGGFGGAAIALIRADQRSAVQDTVVRAFADAGYVAPSCFTVQPSNGAARER